MLAARLHGPKAIQVGREVVPTPGPGEVLLQMGAVGLCGSDLHWYQDARIGDRVLSDPFILGHEFAGIVVALGPDTHGPPVGARVGVEPAVPCGHCQWCEEGDQNLCPTVRFHGSIPLDGALREYLAVPAANCFALPDGLSMAEGALIETLGVAIHALDLGHLRLAAGVAVFGGGSVGLLVAQLALLSGATSVFVSDLLAHRRALAASWGCIPIDAGMDSVARIMEGTGGRGVDVAFECAGAGETPQQACDVCEPGGTVVLVGIPCDDHLGLTVAGIRRRGLTVRFSQRSRPVTRRSLLLVESGKVSLAPLITHRFPLARAADAFQCADQRLDGVIKAVVLGGGA